MDVQRVGMYRELPHGEAEGPSILEKDPLSVEVKETVVGYLRSGAILAVSGARAVDYFTGSDIGALNLLTDGDWIWYSDLSHYLDSYDVRLSAEFVSRAVVNRVVDADRIDMNSVEERLFG